jgi:hypothetical protein
MRRVPLVLMLLTGAGCSSTEGLIHEPPTPTSSNPASITIYRAKNPEAAIAPMIFTIDDTEIYGLRPGQSFTFRLDPGSYTFGWYLGLNTCRQAVWIQPKVNVRLRMSPDCNIPSQPG